MDVYFDWCFRNDAELFNGVLLLRSVVVFVVCRMKVIGIDPGKNTGIAIYDRETRKLTDVYSDCFWGAIFGIEQLDKIHEIIVITELPQSKTVWHKDANSRGAIERTAVNVGSVIREAELIIEYLGISKIQTVIQRPQGKVNAKQFKKITGWDRRTNQHGRDAGMLCYGFG